jgi:hypothetical protein
MKPQQTTEQIRESIRLAKLQIEANKKRNAILEKELKNSKF